MKTKVSLAKVSSKLCQSEIYQQHASDASLDWVSPDVQQLCDNVGFGQRSGRKLGLLQ